MSFDLRVRLHNAAGVQGRVLQTLTRTLTGTESTDAQLVFTMSGAAVEPPQMPFVAGVEYTYDGKAWRKPRNNLFMFDEDSRDEADETQTVTFTGTPYLSWLMGRGLLQPLPSATMNGERVWGSPSSAGRVLATMISEAKARGWAPNLTYQFAAGYDSNGVAWVESDKVEQSYKHLDPISKALSFAVEQGLCDWWTEGMELKVVRPGTGVARPDVVLGGSRMSRVPTSRSFADVFTHLTVVGEHADHLLHLTNTGASTEFGRLESSMTQSGVGLDTTMTRMAQPFMQDSRAVRAELSYEWTPLDDDMPRLWDSFQVGDNVTCITRTGRKSLRVVGYVVSVDGDKPTIRVVTGNRRLTKSAQVAKRLGALTVAGKVGGTGSALPPSATAASTTPAVPTGLAVESNTATWTDDGKALAVVKVVWEQIATAVDGSGLDVVEYEVWWRVVGGQKQRLTATTGLSVATNVWTPGTPVLVSVRGRSVNGKWGSFSTEISATPAVPLSITPLAPSGITVTSNTAEWLADGTARTSVALAWNAVTQSDAGEPITVAEYEVWVRRDTTPSAMLTRVSASAAVLTGLTPEIVHRVKVRAISTRGVVGAFTSELAVTPVSPLSIVPKAPVGLAVASNTAAFQSDGSALATVTVTWTPVTQSTDNVAVTIQEYEFRVGLDTQRVTAATATFTVPSGRQATVSVRARTSLDIWGDPSSSLSVTGAAPAATIPAPSAPVLTPGMGGVAYRWDGLSSTATAMPAGSARIVVDTAPAAAGPWTSLGAPLSAAGGGSVAATAGTTVFVRFRSFDTLGRLGGTSTVVSATALGVALGDIAPDLAGSLDAIRFTADGKNRIYTSTASPGAAEESWRNRHTNPDLVTGLTGWGHFGGAAALVVTRVGPFAQGEVGTNVTRPGYVAHFEATAAGIASAYIGEAIPVVAGETITASLYIRRGSGWTGTATPRLEWSNGTRGVGAATTLQQSNYDRLVLTATVPAGVTTARISVLLSAMVAGNAVRARMAQIENGSTATTYRDGSSLAGPRKGYAWTGAEGSSPSIELTSAFTPGDQWWQLDATSSSIVGVKVWNGVAWIGYLLVAEQIIAAASIKAPLIDVNQITVNHVTPSFGDDLNLSANESVTIIVGRQNEQGEQIADLGEGVTDAQGAADAAANAAGDAQATADGAATAAAVAAASANDVGQRLDRHQTYYRFGVDGLAIGDPNVASELRLKPDRIEMTQNNVVVSYWEGGVFVADEARLDSAQIGNHQFMAYGAGRTIVRPL